MSFELSAQLLEEAAHRAAELYAEILLTLEKRPVAPGRGDELHGGLLKPIEEEGAGMMPTLDEFVERVLPNSMGTPHPLYLGLVNCSPLPMAPLADLLVSGLNNNGGARHQSPAASAAEDEVIRAFARLVYRSADVSGQIVPGGTYANLHGILLARTRHFPRWRSHGPQTVDGAPLLYTSEAAHFSVTRAAQVAGIGEAHVISIPCSGRGAMDGDALARRLARDRRDGHSPFCVVATVGTTGTGAIDPLADLVDLCREHGLWLHVDACYGGGALLLEELRLRLASIQAADSVAVDPHKWFFLPIVAGLVLTPHADVEHDMFGAIDASYVPRSLHVDPLRRGLSTSRRSSGLTVWMTLRAHGWRVIRDAVRRNIELTRLLERLLADRGFSVLPDGELSIACARWAPEGLQSPSVDGLQQAIAEEVVASGKAWFATVRHQNATWLRFNMVNLHTTERHIRALADLLADTAHRLVAEPAT